MTLAFEDVDSKLLDVVNAEECVDSTLVEILKLRFGRAFLSCFWSQYWS